MIWKYFPVGMRFPVPDFATETKRRCWELALSALASADSSNVQLYDAEVENGIYGFGREYLCILCFEPIAQSRYCVQRFLRMPELLACLTIDRPLLQANALESFGNFTLLGITTKDGDIHRDNQKQEFFPEHLPDQGLAVMEQSAIALCGITDDLVKDRAVLSNLLRNAADRNSIADRVLLPDPLHGFCYSMIASAEGRFDRIAVSAADGTTYTLSAGLLPNGWTVFDVPHPTVTEDACLTALTLHGHRRILVNRVLTCDAQEMRALAERHPTLNIKFLCEQMLEAEALDTECWTTFVLKTLLLSERFGRAECLFLHAESIDSSLLHRILSVAPSGSEYVMLFPAESGNSVGNTLHF